MKGQIEAEMESWEKEVEGKGREKGDREGGKEGGLEDWESYFDNEKGKGGAEKRKAEAERERLKGNEAIRSKDYQEAIGYYTRSVESDPTMHQSWANRALAHLKTKSTPPLTQTSRTAWTTHKRQSTSARPTQKPTIARPKPSSA